MRISWFLLGLRNLSLTARWVHLRVDATGGGLKERPLAQLRRRPAAGQPAALRALFTSCVLFAGGLTAALAQAPVTGIVEVVAADEFGLVTSGGAGEVLKSLPGIAADLGGRGEPYTISMNGVPSGNVPITVGGFNLAQSGSTAREVGLHQITIDTFSCIEVTAIVPVNPRFGFCR
jgi:hypothetical protein